MKEKQKPNGKVTVLCEYKILHEGWEMDNDGWIVSDEDGMIWLKETSHERYYYQCGDDAVSALRETIKEHEDVIKGQKKALSLLQATQ